MAMNVKVKQMAVAAGLLCGCQSAFGQILAVNNDLALDAFGMPNLGFELRVGERSTVALNGVVSQRLLGNDFKMVALQPEYRYWFGGRPMMHYFVGIGGIAATYDVNWKGHIYKGEAAGAGITLGYVLPLSTRINVDFHAGMGFVAYKHKEYYQGDHYEYFTQDYNRSGAWMMPTRVGVSVAYIMK